MTKRFFSLVLGILLTTGAEAQFWSDDASASSYDSGWLNGSGATSNLGPWSFDEFPGMQGVITYDSIDATTVGGQPQMNSSGRAWVTTMTSVSSNLFWEGRRNWPGVFPTGSTGTISMDVQCIPVEMGQSEHTCYIQGNSAVCVAIIGRTGFNWAINNGTMIDTNISSTYPIRIKYTFVDPTTFDIEIKERQNNTYTFSATGLTHMGADTPNCIRFTMDDTIIDNYQSAMIINNINIDPSGTLPVELDYFMVE